MGKKTTIILYALIIITVVVMGLFYFGGGSEDKLSGNETDIFYVPSYTSLVINYAIILLIVAMSLAVITAIVKFLTSPKESAKSLLGIACIAIVLLIAYVLSQITPVQLSSGELFTDSFSLRLADVCLYSTWILLILTVGSIVVSYIFKSTR